MVSSTWFSFTSNPVQFAIDIPKCDLSASRKSDKLLEIAKKKSVEKFSIIWHHHNADWADISSWTESSLQSDLAARKFSYSRINQ